MDIAKRQKEARDLRGIYVVPADDKEYDKLISELRVKLAQPKPPAMPVLAKHGATFCDTAPPQTASKLSS